MKLTAKLTAGWDYQNPPGLIARKLYKADLNDEDYIQFLSSLLIENNTEEIYQLEELFRKSTQGFKPIKRLVGALTSIADDKNLICYIDAFAYSFLTGAKNFDLLLQFDKKHNNEFIDTYKQWSEIFSKLENFERFGKQNISDEQKKQYLDLRKIVSRPSARDEIRTLATLLVSGPSTLKEVKEDLGLNYSLGQRTIGVFKDIKVVEKREGEKYALEYAIATEALPVVIFCLRETIGLDLLSNLDIEEK